jgi:epoxyqueuosine reductase QueG
VHIDSNGVDREAAARAGVAFGKNTLAITTPGSWVVLGR